MNSWAAIPETPDECLDITADGSPRVPEGFSWDRYIQCRMGQFQFCEQQEQDDEVEFQKMCAVEEALNSLNLTIETETCAR